MGRFPFLSRSEEIRWARRAIKYIRASWRPRIVVYGPRRGYLHSESSRLTGQMRARVGRGLQRRGSTDESLDDVHFRIEVE